MKLDKILCPRCKSNNWRKTPFTTLKYTCNNCNCYISII